MVFPLSPLSSFFWTPPASGQAANSLNSYLQINFSSSPEVAGQMEALNGLYARAYQMLAPADQLTGVEGRINFSQPPTRSSDREVADIAYFDQTHQLPQSAAAGYQFQVQQIARNQVNQGAALSESAAAAIGAGANTFLLTVGGTGYTLSVIINPSDTNATGLSKIAQAIDAAGAGVSTALPREAGQVQLNLYGSNGAGSAFSLADLSGNAVSATGINNSVQSAADAKFLMNGATYIQAGNLVSLEDGHLQVLLKGTGSATVTTGSQAVVGLVQALTASMSSFGSYLAQNRYLTPALSPAWSGLVNRQVGMVSNYGFERGSQGRVGLDTLRFTRALQQDPARTGQAVSGLASQVRGFVHDLTSYPAATLLASPPTSGYGAAYLRSAASAPWRYPGAAFRRFA